MKDLFDSKDPLLWDSPIPVEKRDSWLSLIAEAVQAGEVVFPRKSRPDSTIGGPRPLVTELYLLTVDAFILSGSVNVLLMV